MKNGDEVNNGTVTETIIDMDKKEVSGKGWKFTAPVSGIYETRKGRIALKDGESIDPEGSDIFLVEKR